MYRWAWLSAWDASKYGAESLQQVKEEGGWYVEGLFDKKAMLVVLAVAWFSNYFLNDELRDSRKSSEERWRTTSDRELRISPNMLPRTKKLFTVEPVHNRQSRRQPFGKGQQKSVGKTMGRTHFPASMMCRSEPPFALLERRRWSSSTAMSTSTLLAIRSNFCGGLLEPWNTQHFGTDGFPFEQD
ncbi:hypothetical protein KIN20_014101 [Parelaphostrongylus tenuis]|uniref:Uncharacterized protein n=1 Tax=Parelaphostrongylus tenuis TaxID=148309 RepID=A0AAD5QP20_PARTN|nr:hypothetical protein KIN20_014101 [Parelaphostrongylus tenuis]